MSERKEKGGGNAIVLRTCVSCHVGWKVRWRAAFTHVVRVTSLLPAVAQYPQLHTVESLGVAHANLAIKS